MWNRCIRFIGFIFFLQLDTVECKIEKLSLDELEPMYKNVTNFTPLCLEQVSRLLDKSGSWVALANLLDLEHLIHTDMIRNAKSKGKELLQIAVVSILNYVFIK